MLHTLCSYLHTALPIQGPHVPIAQIATEVNFQLNRAWYHRMRCGLRNVPKTSGGTDDYRTSLQGENLVIGAKPVRSATIVVRNWEMRQCMPRN
jgi:hypothetical protein